MKLLAKLEKNQIAWILIALCVVFFFLRLPSLIEPYWYGDEGIYEVVGQAMNHGHLLYRDIWDNKPPLLYVVYALSQGDQPTVKVVSLIVGLLTVIAFFFLSQKLFNKRKISVITTSLFVLLFATPFLEANIANAEDFILLPILLAGILIYNFSDFSQNKTNRSKIFNLQSSIFISGLLLGIAFLFKIVAIFDLAAFILFIKISNLPEKLPWKAIKKEFTKKFRVMMQALWSYPLFRNLLFMLIGFLLPFVMTVIYFAANHALIDYFQAAFFGNVDYVGWQNSFLGIPQGLLLFKFFLLALGAVIIFWKRKLFSKPVLFISTWLIFSVFNAFFSGRPYIHYSIVLLPSFCLFVGLLFTKQNVIYKTKILAVALILVIVLFWQFNFSFIKSYAYYQNVIQFISGHKTIEDYQSFFDQKVPRDYSVATFIESYTTNKDSVFIWGNNPQIYALSHKLPINKYTVAYHITQNTAFDETQQAINRVKPKYVIVLSESEPLPFAIPLYIMRYTISGATIYERSL